MLLIFMPMSKINVLLYMFIVLNFIARTVVLLKNTIYKLFHRRQN